jgi:hypothetical protein
MFTRYSSSMNFFSICACAFVSGAPRQTTLHVSSSLVCIWYRELKMRSPRSTSPRFSALLRMRGGWQNGSL